MLQDASTQPLTTGTCALLVGIWFALWNRRVEFERVGLSYKKVVVEGERWRIITATFSHLEMFHVLFNVYSLYSCGEIETALGSFYYFKVTCILIVSFCAE